MRALVRLGLCLVLGSWPASARAQAGGDVMEDDPASEAPEGTGTAEDDDEDDGGWDESGGGSSESGVHFGLRLAYGFPMGETRGGSGDNDLSDGTVGQIPIWVDLGWQFTPAFMAGLYFSYGFVLPSEDVTDACDRQGVSCHLSDIRLGVQAQLSFSPRQATDPWIGAGFGYEWLRQVAGDNSITLRGWEMAMLQGGLDFGGDSGGSTFGPFVAFTFGKYSRYDASTIAGDESDSIDDTATHHWLFAGLRGALK